MGCTRPKRWGFRERKQARTEHYFAFVYGWRQRDCCACAGTGYYDNDGSPPCGGCEGTGKESYRGPLARPRGASDAWRPGIAEPERGSKEDVDGA